MNTKSRLTLRGLVLPCLAVAALIPAANGSRSSANYTQPSEAVSSGVLEATSGIYTHSATLDVPYAVSSTVGAPQNYALGAGHLPQLYTDLDGDGTPDIHDLDDDDDGWPDTFEVTVGTDPRRADSRPSETENGDKDIWNDAFEMLFGLDGGEFDTECPITFGTETVGENVHVTYSFTRRADLSVLSSGLEVSFSANPDSGFTAVAAQSSTDMGSGFVAEVYRDLIPVNAGGVITQRFGRVVVAGTSVETYGTVPIVVAGDTDDLPATSTLTRFSVPVVGAAVARGTVTGTGGSTLVDANAAWPAFATNRFYLVVTSGPDAGAQATITSSTASELTLTADLSGSAVVGQTYEIRKHITIGSLFGSGEGSDFRGAGNSSDGDNVLLTDAMGGVRTFFYANSDPAGWKDSSADDATHAAITQPVPVAVRRRYKGAWTLYPTGAVRRVASRVRVAASGNTFLGIPNSASIAFSELGLDAFVTRGANPVDADNVLVFHSDDTMTRYFYLDFDGNTGWHDASFVPAGVIPPGSAIIYQRKAGGPFDWNVPTATPNP